MPEEPETPNAHPGGRTSSNDASQKQCAHEGCGCKARAGESPYCSDHCAAPSPEDRMTGCLCAHDDCLKECDLIMKGGITSGIVYPPLVIKLARKYRFRNVGGTSAGAIAAAVTAASEHGRRFGGLGGKAFDQLDEVKEWLRTGSNLRNLFQPTRETRPLLDIFLYFTGERHKGWNETPWRAVKTVRSVLKEKDGPAFEEGARQWQMKGHAGGFGAALALSAVSILLYYILAWAVLERAVSWTDALMPLGIMIVAATVLAGLAGNWAGGIMGGGKHLYHIITHELKENRFGICDGLSGERPGDTPPLTEWLDKQINLLAGLKEGEGPLTFGQLWRQENQTGPKQIDLTMVTSNLSQGQPYILPLEGTLFLFSVAEFGELFPQNVLKHMLEHGSEVKVIKNGSITTRYKAPAGYLFLPEARDFPVIVAARMSLSFPVLISAIPLYTIMPDKEVIKAQRSGLEVVLVERHMQKNLFSDGGICSNFPIHFFDSWLPRRPTFGINLTSLPENKLGDYVPEDRLQVSTDEKKQMMEVQIDNYSLVTEQAAAEISSKGKRDTSQAVFLPGIRDEVLPTWVDIPNLPRFLGEVFNIAQNYRDNTQAHLPGYRERIVSIALSDKEGGLNLEMDPRIIKEVITKGEIAGDKLLRYFKFEQHQWVRFRVLVRELERNLMRIKEVMADEPPGFDYRTLIEQQRQEELFFPSKEGWGDDVAKLLDAVRSFMRTEGWTTHLRLMKEEPYPVPEPKLRVTPNI